MGIFRGLHIAQPLVDGISGAIWQRVASKKEGTKLFMEALSAGAVYQVNEDGMVTKVEQCMCDVDGEGSGEKGNGELASGNGSKGE